MNRYKVTKVLGDGTFGSVLRAQNKTTGEWVAIKKMKQKYYSWEECKKLREINALRKLIHPNIIKLKEVIRENDELHLIFEFCDRGNMYEYTRAQQSKGRPMHESKVRSMMFQTMQAVHHMHKHGFFHRDLKPDNLLVSGQGEVKLADFGLAREIRARPPFTDYVSTRWYRAPEVLLRSAVYNSPLDIWAAGAILAELYTLRPLFPGASEQDQLYKICTVLGTPTQAQWSEGHRLAAQLGVRLPQVAATALEVLIPESSPNGLDSISQMLQWDPGSRPSASKVLAHPFFETCAAEHQELPPLQGHGQEQLVSARGEQRGVLPSLRPSSIAGVAPPATDGPASWTEEQRGQASQASQAPRRRTQPSMSNFRSQNSGEDLQGSRRLQQPVRPEDNSWDWQAGQTTTSFLKNTRDRMAGSSTSFRSKEHSAASKSGGFGGGFNLPRLSGTAAQAERQSSSLPDSEKRSPHGTYGSGTFYLRSARYQPGMQQATAPTAAVQSALDRWGTR